MQNIIREIRTRLRLSMNGVTSQSMREKGVNYKLNFGVPIPRLRQIAANYSPDTILAEALWKEDVRELRILATLICPPTQFHDMNGWVNDIRNLELAEQASMNLFCKVSGAENNASQWITSDAEYVRISGFLLFTRLLMQGVALTTAMQQHFLLHALDSFVKNDLLLHKVVLNAVIRFGRQSKTQAEFLLTAVSANETWDISFKENLIQILEAELDLYL